MLGIGGKFLDLLYPPQCLGCNLWFSFGDSSLLCPFCKSALSDSSKILCRFIDGVAIFSRFNYDKQIVAKVIHSLKYEHIFDAAEICGGWIFPIIDSFSSKKTVFIPVPLHISRMRERGFNQSEYICWAAGKVPEVTILIRLVKTRFQALLKEGERRKNVSGAFFATKQCDSEAIYVIIDDVITSGGTLRDCIRALRLMGARRIYGVTIASTNDV